VGCAEFVVPVDEWYPVIAAPTMRVPMPLPSDTVNPYLATLAALHRAASIPYLGSVAFPGMGTGIGGVTPTACARQMRMAYETFTEGLEFSSWIEAHAHHAQLIGVKPRKFLSDQMAL
jgi:O-acetyl-ADP-ribose deacetylase (regulator of RNase III)